MSPLHVALDLHRQSALAPAEERASAQQSHSPLPMQSRYSPQECSIHAIRVQSVDLAIHCEQEQQHHLDEYARHPEEHSSANMLKLVELSDRQLLLAHLDQEYSESRQEKVL